MNSLSFRFLYMHNHAYLKKLPAKLFLKKPICEKITTMPLNKTFVAILGVQNYFLKITLSAFYKIC